MKMGRYSARLPTDREGAGAHKRLTGIGFPIAVFMGPFGATTGSMEVSSNMHFCVKNNPSLSQPVQTCPKLEASPSPSQARGSGEVVARPLSHTPSLLAPGQGNPPAPGHPDGAIRIQTSLEHTPTVHPKLGRYPLRLT